MTPAPATNHAATLSAQRPWGHYEVLVERPGWKLKCLVVAVGGRLSLQRHHHRHEHWFVLEGLAQVEIDATPCTLGPGQSVNVPQGAWHRLANIGARPLQVLEVQTGAAFGEDDIERAADDYGRHLPEQAS